MKKKISNNYRDALEPIVNAYDTRLRRFGPRARAVFWKNELFQSIRYDLLSQILSQNKLDAIESIHDFGCGYGAFFTYLKNHDSLKNTKFYGTDISKDMLKSIRHNFNDERIKLFCSSKALVTADYTFASGTYNMKLNESNKNWKNYVETSLLQLWSKTRKGLAFNMLRDNTETQYNGLYYINGEELLSFCKKHLSNETSLQTHKTLPDWTFLVFRQSNNKTPPLKPLSTQINQVPL